jgi:hypothetical protein
MNCSSTEAAAHRFGFGTIQRFLSIAPSLEKKMLPASEQDGPDILKQRQE